MTLPRMPSGTQSPEPWCWKWQKTQSYPIRKSPANSLPARNGSSRRSKNWHKGKFPNPNGRAGADRLFFAQPGETDRTSNRADSIGCELNHPQTFGTDMKPFLDKNWHQHEIGHAEQAGHRNQEKDGAHLRVSPNPLHSLAQQRPCVAHIRDALPDWQGAYR